MAKKVHEWVSGDKRRYVLSPEDVPELENHVLEYTDQPREHAEEAAYSDYKKKHHLRAAAHHLVGMRAAAASGEHADAKRHKLVYTLHLKALGMHDDGKVPTEIQSLLNDPAREPGYRFQAHGADGFLLNKNEDGQYEVLTKSAPPQMGKKVLVGNLQPGMHVYMPGLHGIHKIHSVQPGYGGQVAVVYGDLKYEAQLHPRHALDVVEPNTLGKQESETPVPPSVAGVQPVVPKPPINYHDPKSIHGEFGQDYKLPKKFDPNNAKHWGHFLARLTPDDRQYVASTMFDHDHNRASVGLSWTRPSDIRNRAKKAKVRKSIESAWTATAPEVKKLVKSQLVKLALTDAVAESLAKAISKTKDKQYTGRDTAFVAGKLPPGAPGADKAGAGVQTDKKKKANKEAARKWKPGKDD